MSRRVTIAAIGLVAILIRPGSAQETAITAGVNWLLDNQDASGFWGGGGNTPFRDAAVVLEVLGELKTEGPEVDLGVQAVWSTTVTSTDYLGRLIIASSAGGSIPPGLPDSLAGRQSADGGWGYQKGYGSNTIETGLALTALKTASYPGFAAMNLGVSRLTATQNSDGGWGFTDNDTSRVFFTSNAVLALALVRDDFNVTTPMQNAFNWLITQTHGDGGFGGGGVSNVIETGVALAAISVVNPASPAAVSARNYLETTQLPNGSWNNDAYTTAEALRGLVRQFAPAARSLALVPGLNLLGLPVTPQSPLSAFDLLASIPGATEIRGWNSVAQGWRTGDFPVLVQEGFFAEVSAMGNSVFLGTKLEGSSCATLESGLNLVSIPDDRACLTAYDLLGLMTGSREIHRWEETRQRWMSVIQPLAGTLLGDDFLMTPGSGHFVRVAAGMEWCPPPCDTATVDSLPDLYLTAADIRLNPNPVAPNAQVFIGARFHNIGTDTVVSPRLDLYNGDPGAGGQLLIAALIPETIPPGDSTDSYWGINYSFPTAGSREIYAIADFLNAIQELDETNNQAHRTLQVTAASTSFADRTVEPEFADSENGPSRILGGSSPTFDDSKAAARIDLASSSQAPLAGAITSIQAGGISSAAAVISWVTDVLTDGCVRYGVISVTENSACYSAPLDDVHSIEIENLHAATTYKFEVISGGVTDNNGGAYYTFTTTSVGAGIPAVLYGKVLEADSTPATGALVHGTLVRGPITSHPLSVQAGPDGTWLLNLGNLKDAASDDVLVHQAGDSIVVFVQAAAAGTGGDTVLVSGSSPQDAGIIVLNPCFCPYQGDGNADGFIDALDFAITVDAVFFGGPNPKDSACPKERLDLNCDGFVDALDVAWIIDYVFFGGLPPCDPCALVP